MKRISAWALYNPLYARLLMFFIKVVLFFLAFYVGNQLSETGFYFSDATVYFILFIFLIALITYPNKRRKKVYFESRFYARQKFNDFLVALSSFFMLIVVFNTNLFFRMHNPVYATTIAEKDIVVVPSADGKQKKISAKEWRHFKAKLKKQLKQIMSGKVSGREGKKNKGWALALSITAGVVLTVVLAALACAIACNGYDILAIVLLAVGLTGIVWGLIAIIKSIYKNKSLTQRKRRKKEPILVKT